MLECAKLARAGALARLRPAIDRQGLARHAQIDRRNCQSQQ
jgi:hypothetical protein